MLNAMRAKFGKWIVLGIIGLIVMVFLFFGVVNPNRQMGPDAAGEVNGEPHVWCVRNGVACDLTRTQYDERADRVFVVPANRYPCTRRLDATNIVVDEDLVERVERFYTCDEFVKRKHKK
jgi:hypothetical protein